MVRYSYFNIMLLVMIKFFNVIFLRHLAIVVHKFVLSSTATFMQLKPGSHVHSPFIRRPVTPSTTLKSSFAFQRQASPRPSSGKRTIQVVNFLMVFKHPFGCRNYIYCCLSKDSMYFHLPHMVLGQLLQV